jgi:lipopolysaccharide biosynthesis regulator YciM
MPPLPLIRLSVFFRSTRTGQLLGAALARFGRHGPAAGAWRGMSTFVDSAVAGDDPRLEAVYRNFAANLDDIVRIASRAGAKTLLCTVVSNLKDCAPLLSQHRAGLTSAELAAWQQPFRRGALAWRLGEAAVARADLTEALRIDPQYADAAFMLGRLELETGETAAARNHLLEAQRWDALRFRPDPHINAIIRQVAARHPGTGLFDAALIMGSDPASVGDPAGRQYLFEHVHLNWAGNSVLARSLAAQAAVLLGGDTGRGAWLDGAGCAAALAYTPHEYPAVLHRLADIVTAPPFTNQLTYVEDQARLAHEQAAARATAAAPETLRRAAAIVQAAIAADPRNPDLAKIAEQIADDRGDLESALAEARRAQQLQPANFALAGDEAIKLARLGRAEEAEKLLRATARTCTPRDLALLAPAFADLFTRAKRFDEARRYFDALVAAQPAEFSLRLLRGRLARLAGETAAAENEYRAILAADPADQNTTEQLVGLLAAAGRDADAEAVSLAAADQQPRNQANNLRAAILAEQRNDDPGALRHLIAAERSGPVNAAFELHLARRLFAQNQRDEALDRLAVARHLARLEGDTAAVTAAEGIIAKLRAQQP